jgi:carbon storage regulator
MLVLSRKIGDSIQIDDQITVVVKKISGNRVTLGIEAPKHFRIKRSELPPQCPQEEGIAEVHSAIRVQTSSTPRTAFEKCRSGNRPRRAR